MHVQPLQQPAILMQVKTMKGVTKVPQEHTNRRRTKVPKASFKLLQNITHSAVNSDNPPQMSLVVSELNSTLPEVMPQVPALAQSGSSLDSAAHTNGHRRHMLWRAVFFVLVSSAFVLTAFRAFTMQHKSGVLAVGVMVIVLWFTVGLTAFTGEVLPIKNRKEGLEIIETVYLCVQILTTVGYGDLTPSSPAGRLFVCVYALSALVMVAALISELADYLVKTASRDLEQGLKVVQQRIDQEDKPIEGVDESTQNMSRKRLLKSVCEFSMWVLAGTTFYGSLPGENKTFEEAFYMSIVTLSTVGFGDQVAKTDSGRAFGCIWMLLGVSSMARMVSEFTETFLRMRSGWRTEELTASIISEMDTDGDGQVDKAEFLQFTLRRYGLVSKEDLDAILAEFDSLDRDKSGFLDCNDLLLFQ